jgi:hypothetical protein
MKYRKLLLLLAGAGWLSFSLLADEIVVSSTDMPDEVVAYYVDDFENSGQVSGPPAGKVIVETESIQVGDVGNPEVQDRVRKGFLLFHLPPLDGRKLKHAALYVHFGIVHDATEKPMPPAWLFHADEWRDEAWEADPRWRGLATSHFGDTQLFSSKLPLCGSDDKPGLIELNVTEMIQADYKRTNAPVAVFRLEISDREALNITDQRRNAYGFVAPGNSVKANKVPRLVLTLE